MTPTVAMSPDDSVATAAPPAAARARLPIAYPVAVLLAGIAGGVSGVSLALTLHAIQHLAYGYSLTTLVGGETFLDGVAGAAPLRRLEVLAAAGPDVLACETVPDVDEAVALVDLARELQLPAWLSFTIAGDATRAGQPLAEAFAVAAGVPQIVAVGVNCCDPADVLPAVEVARRVSGKPVIVYPNSGEHWHDGRWAGPKTFSTELVSQWIAAGARIVGGCCRVRPADIAEIARMLEKLE